MQEIINNIMPVSVRDAARSLALRGVRALDWDDYEQWARMQLGIPRDAARQQAAADLTSGKIQHVYTDTVWAFQATFLNAGEAAGITQEEALIPLFLQGLHPSLRAECTTRPDGGMWETLTDLTAHAHALHEKNKRHKFGQQVRRFERGRRPRAWRPAGAQPAAAQLGGRDSGRRGDGPDQERPEVPAAVPAPDPLAVPVRAQGAELLLLLWAQGRLHAGRPGHPRRQLPRPVPVPGAGAQGREPAGDAGDRQARQIGCGPVPAGRGRHWVRHPGHGRSRGLGLGGQDGRGRALRGWHGHGVELSFGPGI
jgi:hypothetical protein